MDIIKAVYLVSIALTSPPLWWTLLINKQITHFLAADVGIEPNN